MPDNLILSWFVSDPSDQNIQTLMDMGFSRDRVVAALRQTEDDVQSATAILLQGFQN